MNPAQAGEGELVVPAFGDQGLLSSDSWESLGLKPGLLKAVRVKGFERPTVIQAKALPVMLGSSGNFIGQAKNGSGKTAAFALAALSKVDESDPSYQVLVISPTRELAQQNLNVLLDLGQFTTVKSTLGCPPVERPPFNHQIASGTPGKLDAWLRRNDIDGNRIKMVVLDEADTMLEGDGLASTVMKIIKACPQSQRLLFSATFPARVRKFAQAVAPHSSKATLKNHELKVASLCQLWAAIPTNDYSAKNRAVEDVLSSLQAGQAMVFCNTIVGAKQLAEFLKGDGFSVTLLVGKSLDTTERDARMQEFRNKTTTILVTTDVLARGIDVAAVNLVVNYDMPVMYENGVRTTKAANETYLHRVGRAGRMGRLGFSLSFVASAEERSLLEQVAAEYQLPIHEIPSDFLKLRELLAALETHATA